MIKINLLPQNSGKRAAGATVSSFGHGRLVVASVVILMAVLNGAAIWAACRSVLAARNESEQVKKKCDWINEQINKRMTEAEQVRKYREVVNNQMDVLKSLDPPDRILWCEKLNMLSNLVPPDVFLAEMIITEQVDMVETEASKAAHSKWEKSDKKAKEPLPVKRPIISYQLKLTGLALGKDNVEQMNNVMQFQKALTTYAMKDSRGQEIRFMDGFSPNIDFGSIEATIYEGTPVNQFVFTLRTKAMGAEELKKPAAAATQVAAAPGGLSSRSQANQNAMEF